ncbi:hypothetical protein, partial [Vibrio cholerae]|uniref:hypothetical protein n=1 Tax=Vibrio cholerae TaxID=666 RepID=UPI001F322C87
APSPISSPFSLQLAMMQSVATANASVDELQVAFACVDAATLQLRYIAAPVGLVSVASGDGSRLAWFEGSSGSAGGVAT